MTDRVRGLVLALTVAAAAVLALAGALAWTEAGPASALWITTLGVAGLMLVFERQGFVFWWRGLSTKLSLDEVAIFVGFVILPPAHVVLAAAASSVVNQTLSHRSLLKSSFNVSQYTLAAATAGVLVHGLALAGLGPAWGALAGVAAFAIVTSGLLSVLFARLERTTPLAVLKERFLGSTIARALLGGSLGLVALALWEMHPLAPLALAPVLYFLRRFGHLSEWAEQELWATKHLAKVSTAVAGRGDLDHVADRILASCGELFDCGEAQLSLTDGGSPRFWQRTFGAGSDGSGGVTVGVFAGENTRLGSLAVFPRLGNSGYGDREQYLLSTVAASAAAAAMNARALGLVRTSNDQLAASERRYRDLFETANVFVLVLGRDGRIVDSNPALGAALGQPVEELRGRMLVDCIPREDAQDLAGALDKLSAGQELRGVEGRLVARDGREITLLLDAKPLTEPEGVFVVFARDISALKALEGELRRAMSAQGETIKRLENANRELEDFTLWTTHDMREPLRSVGTLAKVLHEEIRTMPPDEAEEIAERIHVSSERLKERVKALHAFSRIVQHDVPFEDVDTQAVAQSVVASLETQVHEKRAIVVLAGEPFPVVRAQPHRLDQVLANLVENALKYASADTPRIELGCESRSDEWRFFVRDNGVGIPADYHARIFQLFQRGPTTGGQSGSGAGLAIVKRIAEQHGGRAWVESKVGEGATFWFTLPRATATLALTPTPPRAGERASRDLSPTPERPGA